MQCFNVKRCSNYHFTCTDRHASVGGSATSSFGQGVQKLGMYPNPVQEPSIDFELEVMVYFNSGKCVFHTREVPVQPKDEDSVSSSGVKKPMTKEKSFTGLLDVTTGPYSSSVPSPKSLGVHPRYQMRCHSGTTIPKNASLAGLKGNLSSSRLKPSAHTSGQHNLAETTVFLIPGLDIKVSYNSKNVWVDSPQGSGSASSIVSSPLTCRPSFVSKDFEPLSSPTMTLPRRVLTKKASCSAWMTLHCIPEETVITPHILDFLEQALEPIPLDSPKASTPCNEGDLSEGDLIASAPGQYAVYGSFPVDVIVYLHVEPSVVRFSCLPVSRVECLLQLPSIELTFSSKKDEEDSSMPSSFEKSKSLPARAMLPSKYSGHRRIGSDYRAVNPIESTMAGMSMTGRLADFSLYIFHPYGGQKKASITTPSSLNQDIGSRPLTGRKDSLSLQVEYVKIDISRSRKLIWSLEKERQCLHAIIRFSASCDVGSASFKYDMRRLSEILAFPKAWYRKAIWRRMFLGDESLRSAFDSEAEDVHLSSSDSVDTLDMFIGDKSETQPAKKTSSSPEPTTAEAKKNKESLWLNLNDPEVQSRKNGEWKQFVNKDSKGDSLDRRTTSSPWETLVVFSLNLSKLNIQMNMGNVMGNTTWLSRGFKSEGRVSIDSSGHKGIVVKLKLDASSLDAKGGIVGGIIELSNIATEFTVKEDRGKEPLHVLKLSLNSLQKRLDYMGTSILMLRISSLDLTLKDEWNIDQGHVSRDHPTKRPALIFIHSRLVWDQLQILMSKSTTPDITKICAKLEEFFTQQFHSSVRVLSALEPSSKTFHRSSLKSKPLLRKQTSVSRGEQASLGSPVQSNTVSNPDIAFNIEARHHRHWQKVLKLVSGVTVSTLATPLPSHGTIVGGTVELTGKNISLACFYGINFRSKAWAIFSLKEPTISFATEAQDVLNEVEGMDTHIIQNLSVSLGRCKETTAQHTTMATVCRMSRSVMFPPQFRKMNEWFEYAFATSDLDEVKRFPVIDFDSSSTEQTTGSHGLMDKRRISSASPKTSSQEFHHNKEVIFALPSLQMELKTEHLQAPKTPSTNSPKPSVDCTFVTDFDDHIFVAVDAEAYFFLHELITSYIRERDVPKNPSSEQSPLVKKKVSKEDSTEAGQTDWRDFFCHTWHLEPTVR